MAAPIDITITTSSSGSGSVIQTATPVWGNVPPIMPYPVSETLNTTTNDSYAQRAKNNESYLFEGEQNIGVFKGYKINRTSPNIYFRKTGNTTSETLTLAAHDSYKTIATVSGDSFFNSWYAAPPTHHDSRSDTDVNLLDRFYSIPDTVPFGWSVNVAPSLYYEDRPTPPGDGQLVNVGLGNSYFFRTSDGQMLYAGVPNSYESTLHGLPSQIYADDVVNGGQFDTVSIQWRYLFVTITQAIGVQFNTTFSNVIGSSSSATWVPNVWRIGGPISVSVPVVPAGAFAYRVQRQWTVNGSAQGWSGSNSWVPVSRIFSPFDMIDPCTGAWLPSVLFEVN